MRFLILQHRNSMPISRRQITNQQGFVMLTVLVFMVILMIVAIASMRSTKDEISIAGSRYFRSQAYQNAQSTLVLTQRCISAPAACGKASMPDFDGNTPGWLNSANVTLRSGSVPWISLPAWSGGGGADSAAIDTMAGLTSTKESLYVIEKMEKQTLEGGSLCDGCPGDALSVMQPFRLTAHVNSATDGSTVLLQRHIWTLAP